MFATWGRFVHRHRWAVLIVSILVLPAAVMLQHSFGGQFAKNNSGSSMEAERALHRIEKQLGTSPENFTAIFSSKAWKASDPRFAIAANQALAAIRQDSHVTSVVSGLAASSSLRQYGSVPVNPAYVSQDGHRAIAVINLRGKFDDLTSVYPTLAKEIHSDTLTVQLAGDLPVYQAQNDQDQKDLQKALAISIPALIVLLLVVFGSLVAAGLPLGVGILAVVAATAATMILARFTPVMSASSEIVTMIGLGVAVDYSLLVVNRFREELTHGDVSQAVATTMATAGRAIVFSGCTVAIGLLGLTFFHFGAIGSIGVAGTLAVALAVAFTLSFLAAMLAILGPRVNAARVPFMRPGRQTPGRGFWHGISRWVMARPWKVLIPTVALLLAFAIPVLHIRLAWSDYTTMPKNSPARQAQELLAKQFPGGNTNESFVVIDYGTGSPLTAQHVAQIDRLSQWVATLPNVTRVVSETTVAPTISAAGYRHSPALRSELSQYVGKNIAVLQVYTPYRASTDQARDIVKTIRADHPDMDGQVLVTGNTAFDVDGIKQMLSDAPMAIGFVMLATYLVLFLLLGSVLLPLKAVLMNLLSVTASYGVLVFIFQDGHFANALGFTPNPIDIGLPIVMFCILFGLSMDYEVMLLSRFKEIYERTGDNTEAVAVGLERTGRLVTGAAIIMASVFFAYGAAGDEFIKAFGIGLGTAIVVDAAIIRALLVPATMRLMGDWNWWAPAPLARLYRRLGLAENLERESEPVSATAPAIAAE